MDASTGEPLRKVNVTLRRADPNPNGGVPMSYSSTADSAGKFVIKDVETGRYRLTVNRTGYTSGEYGSASPGRPGTILSLGRAQKLADLSIKMTPHGVVTGRIVDPDGDPMTSVSVQLMRYMYVNGRRQLMSANGNVTNDLGEYRIFGVAPGRYYLSAAYRVNDFDRASSSDEEFAPTYYPGTFDPSTAADIIVTAGGQARVDLTLSKTRTARISGRLINNVAPAAPNVSVMLMPRGPFMGPFLNNRSSSVRGAEAKFELRGVMPGSYYLTANLSFGGKSYSARQPIEVGTSNIDNITLTIGSGFELQGRLRVDGNTSAATGSIQVTVRPRENGIMFGPIPMTAVGNDGSLTLQNVLPGTYNFFFPGLPEGHFVKSIRAGDTDVLANGLNLVNGAPGIVEIVLSPDAAEATGIVQNPKTQQPMPGATVVFIPAEPNRQDQQTSYKYTTTDQSGSFTIKSITPGEYKAYAWESIDPGAYLDPAFVKPFENKAEAVSVREKSRLNMQLTLIPADASQGAR